MTKEEAEKEINNLGLSEDDSFKRISDNSKFKIHDITPQPNIDNTNSYHIRIGLIDKYNNPTSEELSVFYKLFTKI